tara:strand:- start:559 stop:792 length:234 start_codon:yes stop_codon:yes gene_type:complete
MKIKERKSMKYKSKYSAKRLNDMDYEYRGYKVTNYSAEQGHPCWSLFEPGEEFPFDACNTLKESKWFLDKIIERKEK